MIIYLAIEGDMETKKGYLVTKDKQDGYSFTISIVEDSKGIKVCDDGKEFFDFFTSLTKEEKELIDSYFASIKNDRISKIDNPEVIKILSKFGQDKLSDYKDKEEILYRDLEDKNGSKYGKELLTNAIFPISNETFGFDVKTKEPFNNVFYNSNDTRKIYYLKGHDSNLDVLFIDNEGKKITGDVYNPNLSIYDLRSTIDRLFRTNITRYRIYMKREYNHDNMNRLEVSLIPDGYANQEEHSKYYNSGIIGTLRQNKKREQVRKLHSLNNIKDENIFVYEKDNGKKNSHTLKIMNYIEATLAMIRDINLDMYNLYNDKYQVILKEEDMVLADRDKKLDAFFNEIEDSILPNGDFQRTIEFLNGYINKIFDDIINERYTNISLEYLTELHKGLITYEKNYPLWIVKNINGRINTLYFLYLYVNRDNYDREKIDSSYIKNNIKGILNVIQSLLNLNVIEYDNYIGKHASYFFDIKAISIDKLLDLIRNIKLKELEKAKVLIK